MIKNYTVITAYDTFSLAREVMQFAKAGWKPQGGVSVALNIYMQAMILE